MSESTAPIRGYAPHREQVLNRLRRIEGQVRGIQRMVEEDRYCIEILQQAAAVTAAMDKVALGLLDGHVAHCMAEGADDEVRRRHMTAEMMDAVARLVR